MEKKILSSVLAILCMEVCLVGCNDKDESKGEGKSNR